MNFEASKLAVAVAGWATEGQYALVEACLEAGTESPAHVGRREDDARASFDGRGPTRRAR